MKISNKRLLAMSLVGAAALAFGSQSQAVIVQYAANLDGPSESPANGSPGTGFTTVDYDTIAHTLTIHIVFSGLVAPTTASHIHAATTTPGSGTAGVATTTPFFTGFPIGVTSGVFDTVLDLTQSTSYNPAFVSANGGTTASAELALTSAIASDRAYLNIHSQAFPGGEIRGFLLPVPGPGTAALLGIGGLIATRRRRA